MDATHMNRGKKKIKTVTYLLVQRKHGGAWLVAVVVSYQRCLDALH
jgi:hypothetical protein